MTDHLSLPEMLRAVRVGMEISQQDFAAKLGISSQYLCDIEKGRRIPSVELVERIVTYLGRGPAGRREWHVAAAVAHGWDVRP